MIPVGYDLGTARGRIELDTSDLQHIGTAAHQVGLGLTAIGAAALAGFGAAVGAAAEFEQKIDHFGAVTGASKEEVKAITEAALEMGRTTVFSAIEAAGAMVELGKAGFVASEILGGIGPAVASLAAAGDLPLTQATEILANALRTFNLEAQDAVYVADQLAGAANASTVEVDDLAVSLRYTGGVASSLGIPLHEVADALAILGNNGIRGSTAGTTLRRILLELNPATKKQTEALRELGIIQGGATLSAEDLAASQAKVTKANDAVAKAQQRVNDLTAEYAASGAPRTALEATNRAQALRDANESLADAQELAGRAAEAHNLSLEGQTNLFFDAQGKAKSLGEIFQIVEDRTKHLNAAEKQRVLDIIFGSRAIAGALILAREGAQGFEEISAQIEKVSAAEVAAKRLDNLSGALKRLKNVLITELVGAGTPLQGLLTSIVNAVTALIKAFGGLPGPIQQAILVGAALFGLFAVGAGALLILVSFIARAVRGFSELRGVFSKTNVAKKALDKNVPILAGRLGVLARVAGVVLLPFKLIAGVFASIITAVMGFLTVFGPLILGITAIAGGFYLLWTRIEPLRNALRIAAGAIVNFFQAIPGALLGLLDLLGKIPERLGALGLVIGNFFTRLPGLIVGALSSIAGVLGGFFTAIGGFFTRLPGMVAGFLAQILGVVGTFLVQLPERMAYAFGYMIGIWIRFWVLFYATLLEWTLKLVTGIGEFFVGMFNLAIEWTPKIIGAIVSFFQELPGKVISFLDRTWEGFAAWADRMWDRAYKLGSDVLAAVVEWFQQLPGNVISFLDQTWTGFASGADRIWDRAWKLGSDVLAAIVEWFQQLPGRVSEFMSNSVNEIGAAAGRAWDRAWEFGRNAYNAISDGIAGIPGLVGGVLQRAINAFLGVINSAYNAAKRLASALWNGFKDGLFGSPHTKIEYAMWDMVANVEKSIHDLRNQIGRIQALAMDIANPLSANFNSPTALRALQSQVQLLGSQAMGSDGARAPVTFNNQFHTDADPAQISDQIMWDQLVRVR